MKHHFVHCYLTILSVLTDDWWLSSSMFTKGSLLLSELATDITSSSELTVKKLVSLSTLITILIVCSDISIFSDKGMWKLMAKQMWKFLNFYTLTIWLGNMCYGIYWDSIITLGLGALNKRILVGWVEVSIFSMVGPCTLRAIFLVKIYPRKTIKR